MHGNHHGVTWIKTQNIDLTRGFTTVTVDGAEMHFHGHTSNARAWHFIEKITKKRGVKVINGKIFTNGKVIIK